MASSSVRDIADPAEPIPPTSPAPPTPLPRPTPCTTFRPLLDIEVDTKAEEPALGRNADGSPKGLASGMASGMADELAGAWGEGCGGWGVGEFQGRQTTNENVRFSA